MADAGILYVATGRRFARMALLSIEHLRMVEPDVPVAIVTDAETEEAIRAGLPAGVATLPLRDPAYSWFDKIPGFRAAPFARTLYLDADVIALRPFFTDVMRLLDLAPMAARSAGIAFNFPWETRDYPAAFPQYNTGVVAFDRARALPTLDRWEALRARGEADGGGNQPTFRAALLESGIVPAELPAAYNFMEADGATEPVRLVHFVQSKAVLENPRRRARRLAFLRDLETPCRVFHGGVLLDRRKTIPWRFLLTALRYTLAVRYKKIVGRWP